MATLQELLDEVQRLREAVENLPARVRISGEQIAVVNGLSDVSEKLGLIQAGEFRAGNRIEPGDGFSGVRIAYPALSYGGNLYNVAGIDADTITVAFNSSDGSIITGDTEVTMSSDGLVFLESTLSRFRFVNGSALRSGDITKASASPMAIRSDTDLRLEAGVDIGSGGSTGARLVFQSLDTGQGDGVHQLYFSRWATDPNISAITFNYGDTDRVAFVINWPGDGMIFTDTAASTGEIFYRLERSPSNPAGIDDSNSAWFYWTGSKFVLAAWDGAQVRYKYIEMQDASSDWIASTDAPSTA